MQCILATVPREPHTRSAPHAHHATCTAVYYIRHCMLAAVAWANSASVSGLIDNANVCTRDYARTDARLACIHGPE